LRFMPLIRIQMPCRHEAFSQSTRGARTSSAQKSCKQSKTQTGRSSRDPFV
jgi:hypothetical protein